MTYVDDVERAGDTARWGPALRYHHARSSPRGVNANFVQVLGEGRLAVRTWEFGVEGETLACGTGSAAAAILAGDAVRLAQPVPSRRLARAGHRPQRRHARVYFDL